MFSLDVHLFTKTIKIDMFQFHFWIVNDFAFYILFSLPLNDFKRMKKKEFSFLNFQLNSKL